METLDQGNFYRQEPTFPPLQDIDIDNDQSGDPLESVFGPALMHAVEEAEQNLEETLYGFPLGTKVTTLEGEGEIIHCEIPAADEMSFDDRICPQYTILLENGGGVTKSVYELYLDGNKPKLYRAGTAIYKRNGDPKWRRSIVVDIGEESVHVYGTLADVNCADTGLVDTRVSMENLGAIQVGEVFKLKDIKGIEAERLEGMEFTIIDDSMLTFDERQKYGIDEDSVFLAVRFSTGDINYGVIGYQTILDHAYTE